MQSRQAKETFSKVHVFTILLKSHRGDGEAGQGGLSRIVLSKAVVGVANTDSEGVPTAAMVFVTQSPILIHD